METNPNEPSQNAFERWRHSYSGRAAWVVLTLAIAYVFGSMAIDSGSLWQWGLAVLFTIDGIYSLCRLIWKINGRKRDKTEEA